MEIKNIENNDIISFYKMMCELDNETEFMMYEPGERNNIQSFTKNIKIAIENGDFIKIAKNKDDIIGFIWAERGKFNRIRHSAYVVIGIRKIYCGKGIGTNLFMELDKWCKQNSIVRLELTVECNNINAIKLYKKMGFEIEGKRLKSMRVNDVFVDELYMGKILEY